MTPALQHVAVLVLVGVVAVGLSLELTNTVHNDRAIHAGVVGNCPERLVKDVLDDLSARPFVAGRA